MSDSGSSTADSGSGRSVVDASTDAPGPSVTVNGCERASAEDHTGSANVDIHFPGKSISTPRFTPACIRVTAGSTVTFILDAGFTFHDHGIYAGTMVDGTAASDPSSPIPAKQANDSTPLVVQLPKAGAYGYYCPFHGYLGERGAIFVE